MAKSAAVMTTTNNSDSDVEEFYDCNAENGVVIREKSTISPRSISLHSGQSSEQRKAQALRLNSETLGSKSDWGGRTRLPSTVISRNDFSIWNFLKNCIGKELSKITMPISFNEPLSFLQRVVEYVEYSSLLVEAAYCDDPIKRHELVTAFAVSATASNWERTGKPFNPLLGETYELDREDLGLRVVCEQVSHHPPSSAFHVESPFFTFDGCIHPKIKFWGSSVLVTPKGHITLHMHRHNEVYTWQNINCIVHNVIVGKLWIEHSGEIEIINHTTKRRSVLQFKPCGWTGSEPHKIQGYLIDHKKNKLRAFYGKWIEAFYSVDTSVWNNYLQSGGKDADSPSRPKSVSTPDSTPERGSACDLGLEGQKLLWVATPKPENTSKYYNFTSFAMLLNEIDESHDNLPLTDCRLRPDMRLMEAGDAEGAAIEKTRLEEKQRAARKEQKRNHEDFVPKWFRPEMNRYTGVEEWLFTGEYWKRDWSRVEDIF